MGLLLVESGYYQEKDLVGAFSVIVKTDCATDGSLYSTNPKLLPAAGGGAW